jgi:threonine 3-dehydrogenase
MKKGSTMKALGKLKKEPGIWLYDAPIPEIGPNDLLIKIKKTSLCGTDLHIYDWDKWAQETVPVPLTTGHEYMGIVEKVGSAVTSFKVGDRVSGEGHLTCGICRNCRAGKRHLCRSTRGVGYHCTGCFAEYFALPAEYAFHLSKAISDDVGSILDPLGNAVHTALSFDLVGEDVLIAGAGPIGLMAISICRFVGARFIVITDLNEYRLELAEKMNATRTVNVKREKLEDVMKKIGMKEGFDVGLEMSGHPAALESMITTMNHGGKIALLGILPDILPDGVSTPWTKVIFKSLFLKGIYGREMFETWYKMACMLEGGLDVTPVITHKFPYTEYQKAFEIMKSGMAGKIILEWF